MFFFKANKRAKAKIESRYITIVIVSLILVAWPIAKKFYYSFVILPNIYHRGDYAILFLSIILLSYIFVVQPKNFNRIIQSIEISDDKFKIITFRFDIKYLPFKLNAIELEGKKDDVIYRKLKFRNSIFFRFGNALPFSNALALNYNKKDYYLIPSLFDESDKVIEVVIGE